MSGSTPSPSSFSLIATIHTSPCGLYYMRYATGCHRRSRFISAPSFRLVRGIYYEGWRIAGKPMKDRHIDEFAGHVLKELPPPFPVDALTVSRGVFEALWQKLDPGEFAKLMSHLPTSLRSLRS